MADLLTDFLSGSESSSAFFRASYRNPDDRKSSVSLAAKRGIHPAIFEVIKKQNSSDKSKAALSKLQLPGATVVVTGQQLGIAGGPLFTLYKIMTAVALARQLEKECGTPVVPIFWLQSEDHDFDEIRSTTLITSARQLLKVELPKRPDSFRDSCGDIVISPDDEALIRTGFESAFSQRAQADTLQTLCNAFRQGQSLSDACGMWMQHLCAPLGVLTFDPNQREVKEFARELIASCLLRASGINRVLNDRSQWLTKHGYPVQVPVKDDSPLFFLSVQSGQARQRVRLQASGEALWKYPGGEIRKEELFHILDTQPERFTASALIRPILQDTILPTGAYVCGPTEFNYWVQLTPLYQFFGLTQPLVVPRAQFTVWEPSIQKLIKDSGLTFQAINGDVSALVREKYRGSSYDPDLIFKKLKTDLTSRMESLRATASELDASALPSALELTTNSIIHNVEKFEGKWLRSLGFRESGLTNAFQQVKQYAFPEKEPQERIINLSNFYLTQGDSFLESVVQAIDPLVNAGMQEIHLKE